MSEVWPGAREWLALSLVPGLGCRRLRRLRQSKAAWPDGWLAALSVEQRSYLRYLLRADVGRELLDPMLAWLERGEAHHLLHPGHPRWPSLLDEIDDTPALLWGWGDLDALEQPCIAVVGSRRPSRAGLRHALDFSARLAAGGFTVVSGMAKGIDGAAHLGALEAKGRSIAVLGCGVDVLYPRQHARLRERLLAEGGLLLSELPSATPAHARHFPRRNRLVTGLSQGVLVIEAAMRSGSLISARLALEQNREVFALPGALDDPQVQGCLWLIQEGARLVTRADELFDEFSGRLSLAPVAPEEPDAMGEGSPLLALLGESPMPLDALVERAALDVSRCAAMLQALEIEGRVLRRPGGWIRRREG
ncbi:DNA-processing protein DprA [Halotalea alkalilenta]|uniref:DNA-processing protein DprA n=1 Tax=Halotalea alkalilenta TaxID=376489 RepID=UPI000482AD1F|nr:DNA-processing protein DprA [Halotalea alkalilenta]